MITEHRVPGSCIVGPEVSLDPVAVVGEGTIISGDVEIRADVQVGRYCVLEGAPGLKTVIDCGTLLEDFVRVYPGVFVGARSRVEVFTVLGHPTKGDLTSGVVKAKTDAKGQVRFVIPRTGRWMVAATHMLRAKKPISGDWQSFWASLTFEASGK